MSFQILENQARYTNFRIFFFDETGFGRISDTSKCWAPIFMRPTVPKLKSGNTSMSTGQCPPTTEKTFLSMRPSATASDSIFFSELSERYPKDLILLIGDNVTWHKSKEMHLPDNINLAFIPSLHARDELSGAGVSRSQEGMQEYIFP